MKAIHKTLIVMMVMLLGSASASAQYFSSRKHDQGRDTVKVYNSWQSIFYSSPDTVAINPNVEVYSPFKNKFKPTNYYYK